MDKIEIFIAAQEKVVENGHRKFEPHLEGYYDYIFNHEFAKAFWGEEQIDFINGVYCCIDPSCVASGIKWQYHLQEMVLEKDPILYLEQFL